MIERLLESWLDNATERSFQNSFAYLLSLKGFTVLHITRHCGLEMGKDIIAIDDRNTPIAFQLKIVKNGRFRLKDWREINSQIIDLVYQNISYPSIKRYRKHHKSFLVIANGTIEEEVQKAINDFNQTIVKNNIPPLEIIVKGQILKWLKEAYPSILPSELKDFKSLLELFLVEGNSYLPKEKLATLLESFTGLHASVSKLSNKEFKRKMISAALITSIALSEFSKKENHIAEIEGWVIYLASLFAVSERWKVKEKYWKPQLEIIEKIIWNSLINLAEEIKNRNSLFEGNDLTDVIFYKIRLTYLIALLSILGIWKKIKKDQSDSEFIKEFILQHKNDMILWGEGAIPQFLAFYWYWKTIETSAKKTEVLLTQIIRNITSFNKPLSRSIGLFSPYYQPQEVILHNLGIKSLEFEDTFKGRSYFLEGLMHLFVRRNWKQTMKLLWPNITYIRFEEFEPKEKWQFYLWRNLKGINRTTIPPKTEKWENLRKKSEIVEYNKLPKLILNYPHLLLLFICVYPHRATPSVLKYLDNMLYYELS